MPHYLLNWSCRDYYSWNIVVAPKQQASVYIPTREDKNNLNTSLSRRRLLKWSCDIRTVSPHRLNSISIDTESTLILHWITDLHATKLYNLYHSSKLSQESCRQKSCPFAASVLSHTVTSPFALNTWARDVASRIPILSPILSNCSITQFRVIGET